MPFFFRSLIAIWTPSSNWGCASGDSPTFSNAVINFNVVPFADVVSVCALALTANDDAASAVRAITPIARSLVLLTSPPPCGVGWVARNTGRASGSVVHTDAGSLLTVERRLLAEIRGDQRFAVSELVRP